MSAAVSAREWLTVRDRRLSRLGFQDYETYIASSIWQASRRRYLESGRSMVCAMCGGKRHILLHHKTYERLGDEALDDLVPLCTECHTFVHSMERAGYIDSLDPAALAALSDAERAERNQTVERQRVNRQRADYREIKTKDVLRRTHRSLSHRLRQAMTRAENNGETFDEELALIEAAIASIERKART